MTSVKHDSNKLRMDLVDPLLDMEVAKILGFGADKYEANNWKTSIGTEDHEPFKTRVMAAALRHISDYRLGNKIDEDSGMQHLSHAICNLMFILRYDEDER